MLRRSVLGLGLAGMALPALAAGPQPARPDAALDARLSAIAADPACPLASLSVVTVRAGAIDHAAQFGYRRMRDGATPGLPADADTLYRIASVSKLVTTLGLMRLVESGQVALDADVGTYLGFALRNPHFPQQALTLRMLLSHTSSLRDDAGYSFPAGVALRDVVGPAMWSARAAPGSYFTYCNLGFGIVGTIMERVTGERFDRLMQRLVLAPLGMRGGYNVAELAPQDLASLATLYRKRTVDTEVWDPQGPWIAQVDDFRNGPPAPLPGLASYVPGTNATPFSPTGGLRTGARDLGVLMQMLIDGGTHGGRRILSRATLATMFARAWTDDGNNGDTFLGLYRAWGLGNQQFGEGTGLLAGAGHLGDAYGLRAIFACERAARRGMVVLIGGTGVDPATDPGRVSALARCEERIVMALRRHA